MIVYFDTSALIKLLIDERGSDRAAELWHRADLAVSSQLVYVEARAALAAAHRGARLDDPGLDQARAGLEGLHAELRLIAVDEALARAAGDLAEQHGLRGYDAVHLASALAINTDDVLLATWDQGLSDAAVATEALLVNETR